VWSGRSKRWCAGSIRPAGSSAALLPEISEETALDRLPKGLPTLHQLRALGIRFSLDDFGFGNSSLTMMRELGDVAEIKLDKSIVDNVASGSGDDADVAVARAVIGFAKAQGISIVAEGIEEEAQWTALGAMGADLFQGYMFHRPMPAEQVEQVLLAAVPETV
jgi:EAL domain-containing protein (putative c-di-GMP-specific phosphodiesterase class I)